MAVQVTVMNDIEDLTEGVWEQRADGKWVRVADDIFIGQSYDRPVTPVPLPPEEPTPSPPEEPVSDVIPWVETAADHLGIQEIPGGRSNPTIMQWADDLGGWVEDYYKNDDIPWCGLFVGHLMNANGIDVTISNPLSARAWAKFGKTVDPCFGAIMVFSRSGGGHVGLYVSEDDKYYHILGGNQSNAVNVTKIAKSRFLSARWPNGYDSLHQRYRGRVKKTFDGEVSRNEA